MTHPLIGVWTGCAFPTQETSLIFFEDGSGLLFYYYGSQPPVTLSEFKWKDMGQNVISLEWIVRHTGEDMMDDGADDDPEDSEEEPSHDHSKAEYTLNDRSLIIHIGLHDFGNALRFAGPPGDFATQKPKWEKHTKEFDPFGPGRQVWIAGESGWQKTPFTIEKNKPWWKFW